MRRAALLALCAGGCGGATGTIGLELVTAPGSTVLADVTRARLTLSTPPTVVDATRGPDGKFHLAIDVVAEGPSGTLTFEGWDASDALVAIGRTPALPVAAIDAQVAIYVAAPDSLAAAPVTLDPPRTAVGTAAYPFGVMVAGGRDGAGAASDAVAIYNVFTHAWQIGVDLPAPRVAPTIGASSSGYAYLLGGDDASGAPTGTLWRYDTTAAPAGAVLALADLPTVARTAAPIALVRSEGFIVGGAPPLVIDGLTRTLTAAPSLPPLAGAAASVVVATDGVDALHALFVGDGSGTSGVVRIAVASADVTVSGERNRTQCQLDPSGRALREDVELTVTNDGAAVADVVVRETMYRWHSWKLTRESVKGTRADDRIQEWRVRLAKGESKTITYTVQYSW